MSFKVTIFEKLKLVLLTLFQIKKLKLIIIDMVQLSLEPNVIPHCTA